MLVWYAVSYALCWVGLVGSLVGFTFTLLWAACPWMMWSEAPISDIAIAVLLVLTVGLFALFMFLLPWRRTLFNVYRRMGVLKKHTYFHDKEGKPSKNYFDYEAFLCELGQYRALYRGYIYHKDNSSVAECKIGHYAYRLHTFLIKDSVGHYHSATFYSKSAPKRYGLPEEEYQYDVKGPMVNGLGPYAHVEMVREALLHWIDDVKHAASEQKLLKQRKRDRHRHRTNDWLLDAWRHRN